MAYRHNDTLHKHKKRETRFRKIAFLTTTLVVIAVLVISIDWLLGRLSNSNTIVSRENTTSVQAANITAFRTEYFQFQATEDWVLVSNDSDDKKFVYLKNDGPLVVSRFVVYVDRPVIDTEADFKATNVLPVEKGTLNNLIRLDSVSSHCNESWPADLKRDPARINHAGVSFVCHPSSKQYNVIVGEDKNDEVIDIVLTDGTKATLTMVYSDLTAYPGPGDLYNIISTFTTL